MRRYNILYVMYVTHCSGAVKIETYDDRIRDFSGSWKQLFGWLNFGSIDEFEEKYRGIFKTHFNLLNCTRF